MNYARGYPNLLNYGENLIFVFGGFNNSAKNEGILDNSVMVIEMYDISKDSFTDLKVKMKFPVFGCLSAIVGPTQILIAGGVTAKGEFHVFKENDSAYIINLNDGKIQDLAPLPRPTWSVLPLIYRKNNSSFEFFINGEELDGKLPENVSLTYKITN